MGSTTNTTALAPRTTTIQKASPKPTTNETETRDKPGYKHYHWHGQLFFEVDGTLVDFTKPNYYLDNIEAEHPEAVYFHFHTTAHGPNEWSNEKKVISLAYGLNLLPDIGYEKDNDGNHVVTYEGTTYQSRDAGTSISIHEATKAIDPRKHEIQHNDQFWVHVATDGSTTTSNSGNSRTGTLLFDINNIRVDFSQSKYLQAGSDQFHFREGGGPYYTWEGRGERITLADVLNSLPNIRYQQEGGDHVIKYTGDETYAGTYRQHESGTNITIRQRTVDIDPQSYRLQDGDVIWMYIHTDQAPDNEH